jgi:UDP:flavonoid glycosyltransferase YjiC (YdhE family)
MAAREDRRRRVLFIGEAVTLAHVVRCVALSRALNPDAYEVCLACDPRYNNLIGTLPFPRLDVWTIPSRQFFTALDRGTPIYREADLVRYVTEDLTLIERFRPDVVVGDFRLSLDVSTRLSGVQYLGIANAYWSRHAQVRAPVPDIALTRLLGVRVAQRLFDLGTPAVGAWHARAFRNLRRRYGLPPTVPDIRDAYTQGDERLYADIAELVPMADLPDGDRFIGPIPWSPDVAYPTWWDSLPTDRPIVYVTLGSSGRADLLPVVLDALADQPVTVVAATAGHARPGRVPANARVTDLLPGDRVAARAGVVVCNGGSPTTYQGLSAGKPVIGICGNLDQYLNMTLVDRAGAGCLLRAGKLPPSLLRQSVQRALGDDRMRASARALGQIIAGYRSTERFLDAVDTSSGRRVA